MLLTARRISEPKAKNKEDMEGNNRRSEKAHKIPTIKPNSKCHSRQHKCRSKTHRNTQTSLGT